VARATLICSPRRCRAYFLMLLRVLIHCCRSRQDLALENLVLRHQLEVLLRRKPKPCLRNYDRILWVWVRWLWPEGWTRQLRIVQPETVIGWHRSGRPSATSYVLPSSIR
jgi:hypothetical protein